jgi:hypothetical protein
MKLKAFAFLFVLFSFFSAQASSIEWQGFFVAGDDSIENFDNSRIDLTQLMNQMTTMKSAQFSSSRSHISSNVYPANIQYIADAFNSKPLNSGEGCFIHFTSHGSKNKGFYLSLSGILPPDVFSNMVNRKCGNAPTVILISACFSGQFITESLKGPNRIIMTAAINDRPSFGCSADTRYTYWDSCLLSEIPTSKTWTEVAKRVQSCIQREEKLKGFPSSYPQSWFGSNTTNWTVRN